MLAPTHSVFGVFLTLTILAIFGIQASLHWTIILAGIIGSLLPDLDMPKSMIGRIFFFISIPLERKFGHRTITHSLIGWLIATAVFTLLIILIILIIIPAQGFISQAGIQMLFSNGGLPFKIESGLTIRWIAAFSIGYLSHLILDMFTFRGSQLFWPEQSRDVIPKNPKYRIETGSKMEILIFSILVGCMIVSFPISKHGLSTSLRWLLATPESAMEEYKTQTTKTFIEFQGTFGQTKEPISGWAEILDVQNKRLIVRLVRSVRSPESEVRSQEPLVRSPESEVRSQEPLVRSPESKVDFSFKSLDSGLRTSDYGLIYTLSAEFSADIIAKHVKFKKTNLPIKITHYTFQDKTRDYLESKISDTALISGTIYLPEGLKPSDVLSSEVRRQESLVQSPKSKDDRTSDVGRWTSDLKPISQSQNKLILYFATKQQLQSLQLDQQFQYQLKADQLQLKSIQLKINKTKKEMENLNHPKDGLTDLGRKMIGDPDKAKREAKLETLTQALEELTLEQEGLELKLKMKELLFSGEVWVRD